MRLIRHRYRPRFYPSRAYFDNPTIQVDWRSGGYVGISTNSREEALAWMAQARALGLKPTHGPSARDCQ